MEQKTQQSAGGPIIVLAVDKSAHSDFAFQYYMKEVHKPGNILHVVHCCEGWSVHHPMDGGPSPGHIQELKEKDEKALAELKQQVEKGMADNGVQGEFHALSSHHKNAWHEILGYQEKVGGAMIVMGSRGQGALRRTMMGSVSDSVVHHAHCPVLVCRHQ